ncbi:MAG TPA: FHA domain-containing protein [Mycobacterium sp.]|jgi:pSer/pThr/pTyr-binding forkhead associated (FHA) protein|nr:FHA domain-containing protein [Mycobacterium sp.]
MYLRSDVLGEVDTSPESAEPGMWAVDGLPSDVAVLLMKRGPNAGSRFLLDRAATSVGRHPNSDIFLDDVTASRRHAEFRRENGQFLVVDIGSLNGTFVNRKPVQSSVLANGDEIQIGKFRLVFIDQDG